MLPTGRKFGLIIPKVAKYNTDNTEQSDKIRDNTGIRFSQNRADKGSNFETFLSLLLLSTEF